MTSATAERECIMGARVLRTEDPGFLTTGAVYTDLLPRFTLDRSRVQWISAGQAMIMMCPRGT
jgi:hypothetical protein